MGDDIRLSCTAVLLSYGIVRAGSKKGVTVAIIIQSGFRVGQRGLLMSALPENQPEVQFLTVVCHGIREVRSTSSGSTPKLHYMYVYTNKPMRAHTRLQRSNFLKATLLG